MFHNEIDKTVNIWPHQSSVVPSPSRSTMHLRQGKKQDNPRPHKAHLSCGRLRGPEWKQSVDSRLCCPSRKP